MLDGEQILCSIPVSLGWHPFTAGNPAVGGKNPGPGNKKWRQEVSLSTMDKSTKERMHESSELTGLALERTLAEWLRTGLAMIGVGLGVTKLLGGPTDLWLVQLLGIVLISCGGVVFLLGYHTYRRSLEGLLETGYDLTPDWLVTSIIGILLVSTFLALLFALL